MGECQTKLSIYNKFEYCWAHRPRKVPRVRGRELSSLEPSEPICATCDRAAKASSDYVAYDGVLHRAGDEGVGTICEVAS